MSITLRYPVGSTHYVLINPHIVNSSARPFTSAFVLLPGLNREGSEVIPFESLLQGPRFAFRDTNVSHVWAKGVMEVWPDQLDYSNKRVTLSQVTGRYTDGTTVTLQARTFGSDAAPIEAFCIGSDGGCVLPMSMTTKWSSECSISWKGLYPGSAAVAIRMSNEYGRFEGTALLTQYAPSFQSWTYKGVLKAIDTNHAPAAKTFTIGFSLKPFGWRVNREAVVPQWTFTRSARTVASALKWVEVCSSECVSANMWADKNGAVGRAFDGLKILQMNTLQYGEDLGRIRRSAMPFRRLLRHPLSKRAWSDAYLSYRYGVRLFLKDSADLYSAMLRKGYGDKNLVITRGYEEKTTTGVKTRAELRTVVRAKMYAQRWPKEEMSLFRSLAAINALPTLTNVWDFIPYSFVVDWFLPVASNLELLDRIGLKRTFGVISDVTSVKTTAVVPSTCPGVYLDIRVGVYNRNVGWAFTLSSLLSGSGQVGSGISLQHLFDGAALLVQSRR